MPATWFRCWCCAGSSRPGIDPIVLAGGATGLIGDPRDVGERTMNSSDTVAELGGPHPRPADRDSSISTRVPSGAVIANNLDWTGPMSAVDFLRDIGKHFSVNVMLSRDTVKRRLEGEGISYTEFSYMLLQAYDYLASAPRVRMHAPGRWFRSVGQHHCRR